MNNQRITLLRQFYNTATVVPTYKQQVATGFSSVVCLYMYFQTVFVAGAGTSGAGSTAAGRC